VGARFAGDLLLLHHPQGHDQELRRAVTDRKIANGRNSARSPLYLAASRVFSIPFAIVVP
jgi:hypothetical protein